MSFFPQQIPTLQPCFCVYSNIIVLKMTEMMFAIMQENFEGNRDIFITHGWDRSYKASDMMQCGTTANQTPTSLEDMLLDGEEREHSAAILLVVLLESISGGPQTRGSCRLWCHP